jgi:hypothetical protein
MVIITDHRAHPVRKLHLPAAGDGTVNRVGLLRRIFGQGKQEIDDRFG